MDMDQQPSTSTPSTSTPLRRLNNWPNILSFGKGKGKFPLANWTSVNKGCGCRFNSGCDIPLAPLVHQEPTVERNLAIVTSTDGVQMYEGNLAPSKSRKDLANWSWVRLGNTRARFTNNNGMEQRQWQIPDNNTDDNMLDEIGDHADSISIEGDTIHSDEERPGLEDLE